MDALKVGGVGAAITGLLASKERQPGESDEWILLKDNNK